MNEMQQIIDKQRDFFSLGLTRDVEFRKKQLILLLKTIKNSENAIYEALKADLNKSEFESYETEIGMVYGELKYMIKNIGKLAKVKKVATPLMHFPSKSFTMCEPYGIVLVMSPWNYPFQLTIVPLIGAIAAGNCVVVKPSNYAPKTAAVICEILKVFDSNFVSVVTGGREVNQALLDQKFDYVFFTGSPTVGKLVMEKCAKNLTPMTLELGGKSPCIVDKTANVDLSAKRIVWGKLLNAGQTCVAPDYILVHSSIKEQLIAAMEKYIVKFYGEHPENNTEYPKIINQHHYNRLKAIIAQSGEYIGGQTNDEENKIAPCIIDNCDFDSISMGEELFGPILPIISFDNYGDIIRKINERDKPLALYLFTRDSAIEEQILRFVSFGGGCINDTIIHLANSNLPFGGVGAIGMGRYHGKESFMAFSHQKSILKKSLKLDINIRYAPYKDKIKTLKKFL